MRDTAIHPNDGRTGILASKTSVSHRESEGTGCFMLIRETIGEEIKI
jgi:hypothetical protein